MTLMPHPYPNPHSHRSHTVRVGDLERSDVCDQLSEHFGAGRLTPDELDERLAGAVRARTWHELTILTADLPHGARGSRPATPRSSASPAQFSGVDVLAILVLIGCVLSAAGLLLISLFAGAAAFLAATVGGLSALVGGGLVVHLGHRVAQVRGNAIGQRFQHAQQSAA